MNLAVLQFIKPHKTRYKTPQDLKRAVPVPPLATLRYGAARAAGGLPKGPPPPPQDPKGGAGATRARRKAKVQASSLTSTRDHHGTLGMHRACIKHELPTSEGTTFFHSLHLSESDALGP